MAAKTKKVTKSSKTIKNTGRKKTSVNKASVTSSKSALSSDMPIMEEAKVKKSLSRKSVKYLLLGVFVILLGALLYLGKGFFVAALVNGRPVSRMEIIKNLEKSGGKQALEGLITQELISQEARKQNITVSDEDVQKEIEKLTTQIQSQGSTLDAALSAQGMTKSDLEKNIKLQKTVQALLSNELKVSDEDVKKYFDENKAQYGKDAKYDDLKESIRGDLEQDKFSASFQQWYQKLQSESDIKYFVSY